MSGLDRRGALQAGLQAFNTVDQIYARQHQRGRQDKADRRADEAFAMRQEQHQLGLADAAERKQDRVAGRKARVGQEARQATLFGQKQQDRAMMLLGRQALAMEQGGELSKAMRAEINRLPGINAEYLLSEATGQALDVAQGAFTGQIPMDDPRVADAATMLFPEMMGKSRSTVKRVAGVYQGQQPGTAMFELDTENGFQPMTVGRGSNDDDEVWQVPLESISQKVQGLIAMRRTLGSKEGRQYLINYAQLNKGKFGKIEQDGVTGLYGQYDAQGRFHSVGKAGEKKSAKPIVKTLSDNRGNQVLAERGADGVWREVEVQGGAASGERYQQAKQYAEEMVDSMASWTAGDGADFKAFGGDRDQAYRHFVKEFMTMQGEDSAAEVAAAPGAADDNADRMAPVDAPAAGKKQYRAEELAAMLARGKLTPEILAKKGMPTDKIEALLVRAREMADTEKGLSQRADEEGVKSAKKALSGFAARGHF